MEWHERFERPTDVQFAQYGSNWNEFVSHSNIIAPTVYQHLERELAPPLSDKKVLDFGIGLGRVALRMWTEHRLPTHGCDINEHSVAYLRRQLPEVELELTRDEPPLPYETGTFDAIYAISIWTHIAPELEAPWLREIRRVLKPDGVAMISTSGAPALKHRKARLTGWDKYTENDLRKRGRLYVEYKSLRKLRHRFPGVTKSYGSMLHDHDYIRREWNRIFESVLVEPLEVAKSQDLVILRGVTQSRSRIAETGARIARILGL